MKPDTGYRRPETGNRRQITVEMSKTEFFSLRPTEMVLSSLLGFASDLSGFRSPVSGFQSRARHL